MALSLFASCGAPTWQAGPCRKGCLARLGVEPELELSPPRCPRGAATQQVPCEWCGSCYDCECKEALVEWAELRAVEALTETPLASTPNWWSLADLPAIRALDAYTPVTRLLEARIVRHAPAGEQQANNAPWSPGNSTQLYEEMGMRADGRSYVTAWLNMGGASILSLAEVVEPKLLEACVCDNDFLLKRLKLVPGLMKAKFPMPSPGPELAETVGSFFGMQNVSVSWEGAKAGTGLRHVCIQVDLYSRWFVRMGMQNGCFRLGNVVELLLVDIPEKAIISALRISVTEDFIRQAAGS